MKRWNTRNTISVGSVATAAPVITISHSTVCSTAKVFSPTGRVYISTELVTISGQMKAVQIWWTVAMPLVRPALAALAIFVFLGNWTAFIWPLIVTNSVEMYTLPVGLKTFSVEQAVEWELIMTGAAISVLPTLIVFLIFQRFIIRGVVMAGLKG